MTACEGFNPKLVIRQCSGKSTTLLVQPGREGFRCYPGLPVTPRTAWVALKVDQASQQPAATQGTVSLLQHGRAFKSIMSTLPFGAHSVYLWAPAKCEAQIAWQSRLPVA